MAFDIVKSRREIIDPNSGFIESLKTYEGKQYKLKRTLSFSFKEFNGDGDKEEIREEEEFSGYSKSSNSSSSSEEDLMEKRRSSFDL